jgi:hypothetical protein
MKYRRRPQAAPPREIPAVRAHAVPVPVHTLAVPAEPLIPQTILMEAAVADVPPAAAASPVSEVVAAPTVPVRDDRNQRILAGISENIRKSLIKPVPRYSPLDYPETPRNTEYVRVKKQIITPHGQVRFSILKDSLATNMLAVFRRASMEWKTPMDLIGFIPGYLEAEAEILNDELLLVGTPGHNEKLAIPIQGAASTFHECFDFVADDSAAVSTPAVLRTSDTEFEVVSRGVITHMAFMTPERVVTEVKVLPGKAPKALQENWSTAAARS